MVSVTLSPGYDIYAKGLFSWNSAQQNMLKLLNRLTNLVSLLNAPGIEKERERVRERINLIEHSLTGLISLSSYRKDNA
jgi:hypothetical protein